MVRCATTLTGVAFGRSDQLPAEPPADQRSPGATQDIERALRNFHVAAREELELKRPHNDRDRPTASRSKLARQTRPFNCRSAEPSTQPRRFGLKSALDAAPEQSVLDARFQSNSQYLRRPDQRVSVVIQCASRRSPLGNGPARSSRAVFLCSAALGLNVRTCRGESACGLQVAHGPSGWVYFRTLMNRLQGRPVSGPLPPGSANLCHGRPAQAGRPS